MKPIIRVENLSKLYHIGAKQSSYTTLRESLTSTVIAPFRHFRNSFNKNSHNSKLKTRSRETIWALKDVSFEAQSGEVVGIIGRNGAGKSTLLKILSRITEPTEGKVDLYGRVGSLLEVGTGFHGELSGRENIYLNGAILGMKRSEIESKFDEIVSFAEVDKFLDTPVKHYSSGMYMRLAFSVAAHLEPEILVIDEVLAVGDGAFQEKCLSKVGEVAKEGRTVLFVSHNMNAIEQLCTSALRLENGCIKDYSHNVREVIKGYLFANDEFESSEWVSTVKSLDTPWFKPRRFYISDERGRNIHLPVSNDSDIWLPVEAEIEQMDTALTIGYAVYSEEGNLLYSSFQTDEPPDKWPYLGAGTCHLCSKIPKRLLNEGLYRIELVASLHYRQWLLQPGVNAPSITLIIKGGLSDSPHWMAKRPGLLAPVIEWKTTPALRIGP